jgi:hypothetical protein
MFAIEVEQYINGDSAIMEYFNGIFDIKTQMPTYMKYPSSYIFNIGEHWVSVFIDKFRRGEYFDSCGLPPPYTVFKFLENTCTSWKYNNRRIQSRSSNFCGHFAIMFLRYRSLGQQTEDFISNFMECSDEEKDKRIYNLFLRTYGNSKISSVETIVKKLCLLKSRMENRSYWK